MLLSFAATSLRKVCKTSGLCANNAIVPTIVLGFLGTTCVLGRVNKIAMTSSTQTPDKTDMRPAVRVLTTTSVFGARPSNEMVIVKGQLPATRVNLTLAPSSRRNSTLDGSNVAGSQSMSDRNPSTVEYNSAVSDILAPNT